MTESELGIILKNMYEKALQSEKVTQIHLFGIKYASEITDNNLAVSEIIMASGLHSSYKTEVSKGIKLAKYVEEKNG